MFMQKLSNTKFIAVVSKLLILLLIAKVISLVLWWYLPSEGVELNAKKSYQAKYQRVNFSNMLIYSKVPDAAPTRTKAYNINNLILKGLYGSRHNGFAIIAKKASPNQTTIVAVGEVYEGYKLKEIDLNQVIFTKASKDYVLSLAESKSSKLSNAITPVQTTGDESQKQVTRGEIQHYVSNPSQIWKEIAIQPLNRGGKLVGFEIRRVKPNSKMASLGLQKGDIITKANNIRLSSVNDAIKLYKDIDKIDTLALTIERNQEEREIIYEIR
jgi:type II secretion system protein C